MNKNIFFAAVTVLAMTACGNRGARQQLATSNEQVTAVQPGLIFPRGQGASEELFTGKAYVNELVPRSDSTAL